jgi:hypothetical protein
MIKPQKRWANSFEFVALLGTINCWKDWAKEGFLNMVGGCCGTSPAHIQAMAQAVAPFKPRAIPPCSPYTTLSGNAKKISK